MKRNPSLRARLLVPLLVVPALLAAVPAAGAACLSPGEARQVVDSGQALRLGAVARQVPGEILNAELCDEGGRLVYRLTIMSQGGQVVTVTVDARSGQRLN